ncbi:MAG: phytoene/squalene synthase family protein [Rubrivivax sp.]|jgi:phytoene synthase|nr:phytoene/squalene synthase family protein [Rubrivivax sp.]
MNRADVQACRELMRGGSKTFFLASLALPARVRWPARALYAFCRVADDEIDGTADPRAALAALHRRLDGIYAGQPAQPVCDRALAEVVSQSQLPRPLLDALLEGFAWDTEGRRYETLEDLHAYGARVAGTVGAMMAVLMETRSHAALARASELGVAMQLTNIARDVGEDARRGRLYLPLQWMREAGLDPDAWLANPVFDARIARVVQRLLAEADRLYQRGECGVCHLPRACRPAIQAARLVYAEIGRAVQAAGMDSVNRRAYVRRPRQLALLALAGTAWWRPPGQPIAAGANAEPLPAIRFLVEAAAQDELPDRTFYQRTLRMLTLFERQAQRQAWREPASSASTVSLGGS